MKHLPYTDKEISNLAISSFPGQQNNMTVRETEEYRAKRAANGWPYSRSIKGKLLSGRK